jgi:hypothetical protein
MHLYVITTMVQYDWHGTLEGADTVVAPHWHIGLYVQFLRTHRQTSERRIDVKTKEILSAAFP